MSSDTAFFDFMISKGFSPGKVIADGQWQRFKTHGGSKNNRNGYYNYDGNGHGAFGCHRTGEEFIYRSGSIREMTEQERAEAHARMKESLRKAREETANKHAKVAKLACELWQAAQPAQHHDYLTRKGIKPHIARLAKDGRLMLPLYEGDKIVSLQYIAGNSDKRFLTGGKKSGCYALIEGKTNPVFICEGFATASSVHEATGHAVFIAYDSGNLAKVASYVREAHKHIVIAADADRSGVGVAKANEAAATTGATVIAPNGIAGTDWNDAAAEFGIAWVRDQLLPQVEETIFDLPAVTTTKIKPYQYSSTPNLELDENGTPKCIIGNIEAICENLGITLRYNVIAKREEIIIPGTGYSLDNADAASFAHLLSEIKREGMSTSHAGEYVTNICDKNLFNPVAEWVLSKPWDGVNRLPEFYASVTAEGEADDTSVIYRKELKLKRWLISAVAAAFSPNGISAHGVLVFQGKQNMGKTHWFKKLVPAELDLIKDGFILRVDDRDSKNQCLSHWLVELGELDATFKKTDIAQMKAFLTQDRDIFRRAYARRDSRFARRTVFFASVNQREFLHDETGNRRFWVIACEAINFNHGVNMQQLWAQIYQIWRDGESHVMTNEEIAAINEENSEFESIDSVSERVVRAYDWHKFNAEELSYWDTNWKTATQICKEIGIQNPSNAEAQKASNAVKRLNGGYTKRMGGHKYAGARVLLVPPQIISAI